MRVEKFQFGSIRIDGFTYEHDVVIAGGEVHKRRKKPSKHLKARYGHTPLSLEEEIPWDCDTLVIGTGANEGLPVTQDVIKEAERRGVELLILPTTGAIAKLRHVPKRTNAILHVTC
jgi:hypothetical protein